jgi:hypothetical protein
MTSDFSALEEFPRELKTEHKMLSVYHEMERLAFKYCWSALGKEQLSLDSVIKEEILLDPSLAVKVKTIQDVNEYGQKVKGIIDREEAQDIVEIDELIAMAYGEDVRQLRISEYFAVILLYLRTFVTCNFFKEFCLYLWCLLSFYMMYSAKGVLDRPAMRVLEDIIDNLLYDEDSEIGGAEELLLDWNEDSMPIFMQFVKLMSEILSELDQTRKRSIFIDRE